MVRAKLQHHRQRDDRVHDPYHHRNHHHRHRHRHADDPLTTTAAILTTAKATVTTTSTTPTTTATTAATATATATLTTTAAILTTAKATVTTTSTTPTATATTAATATATATVTTTATLPTTATSATATVTTTATIPTTTATTATTATATQTITATFPTIATTATIPTTATTTTTTTTASTTTATTTATMTLAATPSSTSTSSAAATTTTSMTTTIRATISTTRATTGTTTKTSSVTSTTSLTSAFSVTSTGFMFLPSTTATSTMTPVSVLAMAEAMESSLIAALPPGNQSTRTASIPGATVTAAKLNAAVAAQQGGSLSVSVEGTTVGVVVPVATFASLNKSSLALVVTAFDASSTAVDPGAAGPSSGASGGGAGAPRPKVASVVRANLVDLGDGSRLRVAGLSEPIKIVFAVNRTAGLECAYWDAQRGDWSSEGLSMSSSSKLGEPMVCETTHLSLFAAIWRGMASSVTCSQLSLLNAEAIREVGNTDWLIISGAITLWSVIEVSLITVCLGVCIDRVGRRKHWTDEHFLLPLNLEVEKAAEEGKEADETDEAEGGEQAAKASACCVAGVPCCCCISWCRESSALRDVVDEIMSNWFENFSEVRDLVESLYEALVLPDESHEVAGGHAFIVAYKAMSHLLVSIAMAEVASTTHTSPDAVAFIAEDENLVEVLAQRQERLSEPDSGGAVGSIERRQEGIRRTLESQRQLDPVVVNTECPGDSIFLGGWEWMRACWTVTVSADSEFLGPDPTASQIPPPQTSDDHSQPSEPEGHDACPKHSQNTSAYLRSVRSEAREDAWWSLHVEMSNAVDMSFLRLGSFLRLPVMACHVFLAKHPLMLVLSHNMIMAASMRGLFLAMDVAGMVFLTTIFFESSGNPKSKKSKAECLGEDGGLWEEAGRLIVIGVASVVFAGLPSALLQSLHHRSFRKFPSEACPEWTRQLRTWRNQDRVIWSLGPLYVLLCLFVTIVFLANVAEDESLDWAISACISLSMCFLIVPLAFALVMPLLALTSLQMVSCALGERRSEVLRRRHAHLVGSGNLLPPVASI
uniref:GAIN-B domain-containing protein n=1 Tax=Alexandrium monilatum TaxID=311494 RepID=A0A7S4W9E0_9DINO